MSTDNSTIRNFPGEPAGSRPRRRSAKPPQLNYTKGPHQSQLAPTASTIDSGGYPEALYLGLLTRLPASDGTFMGELEAPDYHRQQVTLVPRNATHYCVPRPILFEVHRLPEIAGFGLFDAEFDGELCGYGAIYSSRISRTPIESIVVKSHQLLVRRLPTAPGVPGTQRATAL